MQVVKLASLELLVDTWTRWSHANLVEPRQNIYVDSLPAVLLRIARLVVSMSRFTGPNYDSIVSMQPKRKFHDTFGLKKNLSNFYSESTLVKKNLSLNCVQNESSRGEKGLLTTQLLQKMPFFCQSNFERAYLNHLLRYVNSKIE